MVPDAVGRVTAGVVQFYVFYCFGFVVLKNSKRQSNKLESHASFVSRLNSNIFLLGLLSSIQNWVITFKTSFVEIYSKI